MPSAHAGTRRRPDPADPMPQRGRTLLVVLTALAATAGFVVGLLYLIVESGADADSVAVALLYAALPVPVLVGVYLWLDAYEPEPRRYIAAAFAWGAFGSVYLVFGAQWVIEAVWGMPSPRTSAVYLAPLLEEPAKALILVLTLLRSRRVIDGVVDGFVYAGVAALGFAFSENVLYYTSAYMAASEIDLPGTLGATGTFFGRGVMTPFLHPLFTTWTGVCVALAVLSRRRLVRFVLPIAGLAVAMLAHGCWNGAATARDGIMLLLAYGGGLVMLGGLITWALIARRREGRVLWDALTDMARRRHWLHIDEVPYLARLGLRQRARKYAKRSVGDDTMRSVRAYQKAATRTAFLYDGVMRGRAKANAVPMVDLMRADLTALRPRIVLPPPVRIVKRMPRPMHRPVPPGWQVPPPPGWQQLPPPPGRLPQAPYGPPPGSYGGPPGR